jgi:hypothetical protein
MSLQEEIKIQINEFRFIKYDLNRIILNINLIIILTIILYLDEHKNKFITLLRFLCGRGARYILKFKNHRFCCIVENHFTGTFRRQQESFFSQSVHVFLLF